MLQALVLFVRRQAENRYLEGAVEQLVVRPPP
jgi:hypothetical protein